MKMKQNKHNHQPQKERSEWQKQGNKRAQASLKALREGLLVNIKTE